MENVVDEHLNLGYLNTYDSALAYKLMLLDREVMDHIRDEYKSKHTPQEKEFHVKELYKAWGAAKERYIREYNEKKKTESNIAPSEEKSLEENLQIVLNSKSLSDAEKVDAMKACLSLKNEIKDKKC